MNVVALVLLALLGPIIIHALYLGGSGVFSEARIVSLQVLLGSWVSSVSIGALVSNRLRMSQDETAPWLKRLNYVILIANLILCLAFIDVIRVPPLQTFGL